MTVQTAIGFGAILIAVTFGAHLMPLEQLLPLAVPISLTQSFLVAARHRRHVAASMMIRRILPLVGAGLLVGVLGVGTGRAAWLRPALGALVLGLAALSWSDDEARPAGSPLAARAALVAAGFIQGLLATGGPLLVWGLAREGLDRNVLRATLSAIWVCLNTVIVAAMVADGRIDGAAAARIGFLLLPAGVGLLLGEAIHGRLDERTFRKGVWTMLGLAAIPLLIP